MLSGDILAKSLKLRVLDVALKVRETFGISFNESFFYDKSCFNPRMGNILGLSDNLLRKYKKVRDRRSESKNRA